MLSKLADFVKSHFSDIILATVVFLAVLLAFAFGFVVAKYQEKTPILIEQTTN